jgi:predicted small secreted protein
MKRNGVLHMKRTARILAALALSIGALTIAACNTIHGIGRDIQATGRFISQTNDGNPNTP